MDFSTAGTNVLTTKRPQKLDIDISPCRIKGVYPVLTLFPIPEGSCISAYCYVIQWDQMLIKTYTKCRQNWLSFTLCILFGTVLIWLIWIHKWFNWWMYVEIKWSRPDTNPQVSFSLQIRHRCCCLKLSDGQMFKKIMIRSWLEASFNLYWMESGCCPHQACTREPRVGGTP